MTIIAPTVTAFSVDEYSKQLRRIVNFSDRIHIDLMDGIFAPTISPSLKEIWLPHHIAIDIHVMYQRPMDCLSDLIQLRPSLVIIQAEAEVHHMHFAGELHKEGILAGLALLQDTPVKNIQQIVHSFDHVLVFSGKLGFHGGEVDMSLLSKVAEIRAKYPEVEIGWDGGVSDINAKTLQKGGVDVLNVGGFIQNDKHPQSAYEKIKAPLIKKTSLL